MVHPDYITKPFWELVLVYGYGWVAEQEKIFKQIMEEENDN